MICKTCRGEGYFRDAKGRAIYCHTCEGYGSIVHVCPDNWYTNAKATAIRDALGEEVKP